MPPDAPVSGGATSAATLRETLLAGAGSLGVALTDAQTQGLLDYLALISKWTQVYNLTSVREPAAMLTHHLLDSLAVVPALQRQLASASLPSLLRRPPSNSPTDTPSDAPSNSPSDTPSDTRTDSPSRSYPEPSPLLFANSLQHSHPLSPSRPETPFTSQSPSHGAPPPSSTRSMARTAALPAAPRLLDVGSGAGLPGVVMALAMPEWSVTCVDTVGKKVSFIRQAAAELRLKNLRAEHSRVEALSGGAYDGVVSRAFSSLVDFTQLTRQHLSSNGVWLAMKGKLPTEELAALPSTVEVFHVEHLQVPGLGAERCLVWMRPRGSPGK